MRALFVTVGLVVGSALGLVVGVSSAYAVADAIGIQGYEGPAYFLPGFAFVCVLVGATSGGISAALLAWRKSTR